MKHKKHKTPSAAIMQTAESAFTGSTSISRGLGILAEFAHGMRTIQPKDLQEEVTNKYRWMIDEIKAASPIVIPNGAIAQKRALLAMFHSDDLIACESTKTGEVTMMRGTQRALRQKDLSNFGRVGTWVGSVLHRYAPEKERFLVIPLLIQEETDEDSGAVFRWLMSEFDMHLRAVVKTGIGMDAWFDPVEVELREALSTWLPAFALSDYPVNDGGGVLMPNEADQIELVYLAN